MLSTKKLNKKFKHAFDKSGINFVEIPMIEKAAISYTWPEIKYGIIITSSYALKVLLKNSHQEKIKDFPFFCVGTSTKNRLAKLDLVILECESSAKKLATKIKEKYSNKTFTYFCGKQRLNAIEKTLKKSSINVIFCEIYKTMLIPKKVIGEFDGVLFFSPSAVKSYALVNSFKNQKFFSWGNTTANEIKKYTGDFFISKNPEIKSLIQIIKNH